MIDTITSGKGDRIMARKVNSERSVLGARRRQMHMGACPHCSGDVRRVKDIYGTYLQCIQCSREIAADHLAAVIGVGAVTIPAPHSEQLLVA